MKNKPKVFLLHSEMSPYRLALFEELSKTVDLTVGFCMKRGRGRLWSINFENFNFELKLLHNLNVGSIVINYLLPLELNPRYLSKFDVIIVDDDPRLILSKIFVFCITKLLKKPVIIWEEAIEEGYYDRIKDLIHRYLFVPISKYLIFPHSDAFIAFGEKTANFLVKQGVFKEKIYITPQATSEVDFKDQMKQINKEDLKRKLGFGDKKIILFMGYFTKRKGVIELIEAFKQLNRDDTVLIMAGAGKEERRLKTLASDQGNIYFPGYVEGEKKAIYYTIADIFVLPTFVDPWSLVINEAMMYGLPIITTTGCGASVLIKDNGIVIKPGDINALKEAMKFLLDNDEIRKQMGERSREIIKDCTIERVAETFARAIYTVLRSRP